MPAPASSTNDAAICVTAKSRSRRLVPDVMRTPPLDEAESAGRLGGRQARHERQQHRRHQRQPDADPQQAGVDRQVERADREARRVARQQRHHRPRDRDAEDRAGAAQQQALGQQRAAQRAGARAERRANRQLAFAPHRSRQDQVGDVRARDDEDEPGRGQQHEQHRPRRRGDLIAQLHGVDAEVALLRVRLRVRLDHRGVHRRAARPAPPRGSRQARRRPNSSVIRCTRPVTIVADEVVRAGDDVGDDLGFGRVGHRRLEHADDGGRCVRRTARSCRSPIGRRSARWSRTDASAPPRRRPSGRRRPGRAGGPSTGRRPMTSKYEPLTTPARTTRGSPRPTIVKPIVENSPKAVSVVTRARRSCDLRDREHDAVAARGPGRSGGCRSADPRRG